MITSDTYFEVSNVLPHSLQNIFSLSSSSSASDGTGGSTYGRVGPSADSSSDDPLELGKLSESSFDLKKAKQSVTACYTQLPVVIANLASNCIIIVT